MTDYLPYALAAIAAVGLLIAFLNYRIGTAKLKLDRAPAITKIYRATLTFMERVQAAGQTELAHLGEFNDATVSAAHLLTPDTVAFLTELKTRALKIDLAKKMMGTRGQTMSDDERARYADSWEHNLQWVITEEKALAARFAPYLDQR